MHVEDCGGALAALVDSEVTGSVNIGSGQGSSVADVANTIARILGRRIEDAGVVVAATTRLREEIGASPDYDLETGLRHAIEWWRQRTPCR
jgi:nucleoside-diphosphate-sugar epimerase